MNTKSKIYLFALLAITTILALTLAGCTSTTGGGGGDEAAPITLPTTYEISVPTMNNTTANTNASMGAGFFNGNITYPFLAQINDFLGATALVVDGTYSWTTLNASDPVTASSKTLTAEAIAGTDLISWTLTYTTITFNVMTATINRDIEQEGEFTFYMNGNPWLVNTWEKTGNDIAAYAADGYDGLGYSYTMQINADGTGTMDYINTFAGTVTWNVTWSNDGDAGTLTGTYYNESW